MPQLIIAIVVGLTTGSVGWSFVALWASALLFLATLHLRKRLQEASPRELVRQAGNSVVRASGVQKFSGAVILMFLLGSTAIALACEMFTHAVSRRVIGYHGEFAYLPRYGDGHEITDVPKFTAACPIVCVGIGLCGWAALRHLNKARI